MHMYKYNVELLFILMSIVDLFLVISDMFFNHICALLSSILIFGLCTNTSIPLDPKLLVILVFRMYVILMCIE